MFHNIIKKIENELIEMDGHFGSNEVISTKEMMWIHDHAETLCYLYKIKKYAKEMKHHEDSKPMYEHEDSTRKMY